MHDHIYIYIYFFFILFILRAVLLHGGSVHANNTASDKIFDQNKRVEITGPMFCLGRPY